MNVADSHDNKTQTAEEIQAECKQISSSPATPEMRERFLNAVKNSGAKQMESRAETFNRIRNEPVGTSLLNSVKQARIKMGLVKLQVQMRPFVGLNSSDFNQYEILQNEPLSAPHMPLTDDEKKGVETAFRDSWGKYVDRPDWEIARAKMRDTTAFETNLKWKEYRKELRASLAKSLAETQANARIDYENIVAKNPFISYLPNSDPSPAEVAQARLRYAEDLKKQSAILRETDVSKPAAKTLVLFGPAVRTVLQSHPEYCSVYGSLVAEVKSDKALEKSVIQTGTLGSLAACTAATVLNAPLGVVCFALGGVIDVGMNGIVAARNNARAGVSASGELYGDRFDTETAKAAQNYRDERSNYAVQAAVAGGASGLGAVAAGLSGVRSARLAQKEAQQVAMNKAIEEESAKYLDTPYALGPLGEGKSGIVSSKHLTNCNQVDCTTYVEQATASARASSDEHYDSVLRKIRYQNGKVSFLKRNHLTELDWIPNNVKAGVYKDITAEIGQSHTKMVTAEIDRGRWLRGFKSDEVQRDIPAAQKEKIAQAISKAGNANAYKPKEVNLPYLSIDSLRDSKIVDRIPSGSVFNVVREGPEWLNSNGTRSWVGTIVSHQGFLIRKEGVLYMRHASFKDKVLDIRLDEYLKKMEAKKDIVGLNVLRVLPAK